MFRRLLAVLGLLVTFASPAEASRIALVIGQNAYPGGNSAETGLPALDNPVLDARAMAALLGAHGFDVISCDGKAPGCFDLSRASFLEALAKLHERARAADLALVFFAGHGVATEEGNIVAPTDARVNCETGAVAFGVPVEQIMAAAAPARNKFIILDACRDNPLGEICPALKDKKLSFTRIEAGAMRGLLLVTSTQFGEQALDGFPGTHSPFMAALLAALGSNPNVYFEQVMNEVARETYDEVQTRWPGFLQIPGKVVGGAAPADCLAGKNCFGDPRMAGLAAENDRLSEDAAGVRNLLAAEEMARGTPYTDEERRERVTRLQATLQSIGASGHPLRQAGRRMIEAGNVTGGTAKLDEALLADERSIAEAERIASRRRKYAARGARDLAVLALGRDVAKAASYYQRATALDPENATYWEDYARTARVAGQLAAAKAAFVQAASLAQKVNDRFERYAAMLGLGEVALADGALPDARRAFDEAFAIAAPLAKTDPGNTTWQRNLSTSHSKIGDVLAAQGDLAGALDAYRAGLAIREWLAKTEPEDAGWQRGLSDSDDAIGNVLVHQGNLTAALDAYRTGLAIRDRLARADPGNASRQRQLAIAHSHIGDVLVTQGQLAAGLDAYRVGLAITDRLAKADAGNSVWQRDLSVSQFRIGDALAAQGDRDSALEAYRAGLAIRDRLAKADPGNASWQRDLFVSHDRIGDILFAQRNLSGALDTYRTAFAIVDRLVKTNADNPSWQRDLAVAHDKIGEVLVAQGDQAGGLGAYRAGFAIHDRLAKADVGNTSWQRDLSVSQRKIGEALAAQGDLSDALTACRAAFAIADRLAKADPGNAVWQHDLALSHGMLGRLFALRGERDRARTAFGDGRALIERQRAVSPENSTLPKDLAWFDAELAKLER